MDDIFNIGPLDDFPCSVSVEWQGLGSPWGAVSKIHEDTLKCIGGELKSMGLPPSMKKLPSLDGVLL